MPAQDDRESLPSVRPVRMTRFLLLLALLQAVCVGPLLANRAPLAVEIKARALLPGEPLRIDVVSAEPLATLTSKVFGQKVHMMRASESADGGERWSGWSLITLEQQPGPTLIEARGTSLHGMAALGSLAITVEPKTFPQEELEVEPVYVEPPKQVALRLERERLKLESIYNSRSPRPPLTEPFVRPVPGDATSVFGLQRIYNGKPRSPHSGLDLRAATGTLVRASGHGRVVLAEDLYYSGSTVILDHGGGLFTIYAHLSEILVRSGDNLEMGRPLGFSGATGRVTGPHLHWGAKVGSRPFDPSALLDPVLFR